MLTDLEGRRSEKTHAGFVWDTYLAAKDGVRGKRYA